MAEIAVNMTKDRNVVKGFLQKVYLDPSRYDLSKFIESCDGEDKLLIKLASDGI